MSLEPRRGFCGADSKWDSTCILPDEPEHLDHLDDAGRTWINPAIVRAHDRRKGGDARTLARQIAARARPRTTAKYRR